MNAGPAEITYLLLADRAVPYLLARVRWPDVALATTASRAEWLEDAGLFDLPYDPAAVRLSFPQAASIAAGWGVPLDTATDQAPPFIRRMPANWSDLALAERRAWGIEPGARRRSAARYSRRLRSMQAKAAASADGDFQVAGVSGAAAERRCQPRVPVDGWAHIRSGHATITPGLVDLGEGGLRCVLPEPAPVLAPGAVLDGPFLLEAEVSTARVCLNVPGRVSWQRSIGDSTHVGLTFGDLGDGETEGVQRLLAAASGKGRRQ